MKRKKEYLAFWLSMVILGSFLLVYSCGEEVSAPCGDVTITILTMQKNCDTDKFDIIAPGADLDLQWTDADGKARELSLKTDAEGKVKWTPKQCEMNLTVFGIFQAVSDQTTEYICDTNVTITLEFDPCDPPEVDCNSLDIECYKYFYGENGDPCIYLDPNGRDIYVECCRFKNVSNENIEITNIASIVGYNENWNLPFPQKFRFYSITPEWDGISPYVVAPGATVEICFEALADEIGEIRDVIEVELLCVETNETGIWEITLEGEICEKRCCPYIWEEPRYIDHTDDVVEVGDSKDYDPIELFNLTNIDDGCCVELVSIEHTAGNGYWELLDENGNLLSFPLQFEKGTGDQSCVVYPRFTPQELCCHADTFQITVNLCDGTECGTETLIIEGCGCEYQCPWVGINERVELIRSDSTLIESRISYFNEFDSQVIIKDYLYSNFDQSTSCGTIINDSLITKPRSFFSIYFDEECVCTPQSLIMSVWGEDGAAEELFTITPKEDFTLDEGRMTRSFEVVFNAPTQEEFRDLADKYNRNIDNQTFVFYVRYRVIDPESLDYCVQTLKFIAEIGMDAKISPPYKIDAYNQRTSIKQTPDYQSFKVDYIDKENDLPGIRYDNRIYLSQTNIIGDTELYPSRGTFYVNVDHPVDNDPLNTEGQLPKFYLTKYNDEGESVDNCFEYAMIWKQDYPEESFDIEGDILSDLQSDLQNSVVGPNGTMPYFEPFVHTEHNIYRNNGIVNWNGDADINGGLDIEPGDVLLLYSSAVYFNTNGYEIPCCLALVYIRSVENGLQPENTNRLANIDFRIIWPIYF